MGDGEVWRRWETSTRYYEVVLHQDLLGDWVLSVSHGGRGSNLGALVHRAVGSLEAGMVALETIAKTRKRHGYLLQASLWVETQMAFGQVKQVELNAPAQVNSLQSMLFSLGAK